MSSTRLAVTGPDVFFVFQMDQRPELGVYFQDDMPASASVASVGASFGNKFSPQQMGGTGASVSGFTKDFYIVYKIRFRHAST
jgi:hypothetical protein